MVFCHYRLAVHVIEFHKLKYIHALLCVSLLSLRKCFLRFMHVVVCIFISMDNIPFVYTTVCLSIHLLMAIWLVSIWGLTGIKPLISNAGLEHMLPFHFGLYLGVKWLDCLVGICCQIVLHSGCTLLSPTSNA